MYSKLYFREISGVKISGRRILVTSLAGSLNVLKRVGRGIFIVERYTFILDKAESDFYYL